MEKVLQKIKRYFGNYEFGVFNESGGKDGQGAVWKVEQTENIIPFLKHMNAQGNHLFIRPTIEREAFYMMHDDMDEKGLERHHKQNGQFKPGRMVVESSPGNYQVWVRSDRSLSDEEKKHWLKKMDSDPGASPRHRWGRAPGFRNRKEKYEQDGGFPLAKMIWVDWKGRAAVPVVELPKPQPRKDTDELRHTGGVPPRGERFSGDLPTRDMYFKGLDSKGKPKESEQDFAYSLALLRRGVPRHTVEERIIGERTDWSNHKGERRMRAYLKRTMDRAEDVISTQTYRISVKNVGTNDQRSTVVEDLKKDKAKAILEERARTMAVQIGFEKASDIQVDVKPVEKQSRYKKKALETGLCL
jgi:hypothetical protein